MTPAVRADDHPAGLEKAAYYTFLAFAAALQLSIFASQVLLTIAGVLWLVLVLRERERFEVPRMFWPLAAYAAATFIAAVFSVDPRVSIPDCKQLLLFFIVPIAYRLLPGKRALTVVDVLITLGAISAVIGVTEFGILKYDDLGRRPQGTLGMYMTYSGQLMLVACVAAARILFRKTDRVWASLVMPALIVALAATLSRNAWVGACAGIGVLFLIRDFRLLGLLPVFAALFIAFAPTQLTDRLWSTFEMRQHARESATIAASVQSNRDRIAMIKSGLHIIRDHPWIGVGPDMVRIVYPHYRDRDAVNQLNSHLHNVPIQIAAERGVPALLLWLAFMFVLLRDFVLKWKTSPLPSLATGALASVVALAAAGMFEYNFGDSEVLMLFLVVVTLPYAGDRDHAPATAPRG
jgi:O-antigen ligase